MRRYGIWVICGLFLVLGIVSMNQMIIYTPDSARYLAWANSLASLNGYIDNTMPEPARYVIHAPLYPLLLAPVQKFFPSSVVAAKVVTLLLGALTILLFFRWIRPKAGETTALWASFFLASNPLTIIYSTQILSDVPFAVCVILFFIFAKKLITDVDSLQGREETWLIATIAAGIFLREVGLTLMLGATAFFLWKKEYRRSFLILLVSALLYFVWYVRNEVIVAGIENPAFRNTRLFFRHLYTANDASLVEELFARLWSNISVYRSLVGKLLLMPDFVQRSHSVVSQSDRLVSLVVNALPYAQYPIILLTLFLSLYGLWYEWRNSKSFSLLVVFVACYLGPILFYPINDIRFLYPLLLLMLYLSAIAAHSLFETLKSHSNIRFLHLYGALLFILLAVPNLAWVQNFAANNWQYGKSPEQFFESIRGQRNYPEQYGKPLHLAAQWIVGHSDSSTVVVSRWKELAFWLRGRTVNDIDPQTTPDPFDYQLRDYRTRYIVSVVSRAGLGEYESQFLQSHRFTFEPVYRVANVEVFEVKKKSFGDRAEDSWTNPVSLQDSVRVEFRRAFRILEKGQTAEAETLFQRLAIRVGPYGSIIFHVGVAKEFAGQIDSAGRFFESFRSVPQAGSYIQQAWYHQEIISRLKAAQSTSARRERAERFHVVAVNYWELGFRHQAFQMLRRSLEADSAFFPALIFTAIYSLQDGDLSSAKKFLAMSKRIDPTNVLIRGIESILSYADSLRFEKFAARRVAYHCEIANAYIQMGLRENAIDELLDALDEDPDNAQVLTTLSEIYEVKRRYYPAVQSLARVLAIDPSNQSARGKYDELLARWK